MSDITTATAGNDDQDDAATAFTYARLTADQRGKLAGSIDMTDPTAAMARLTVLNSDQPVSEEDAEALGWVTVYWIGLDDGQDDHRVTRRRNRGRLGSLDSFVASLDGWACNIDPDRIVYVNDADGDTVETTVGQGDDKRRVPIWEARGTVASGLSVRLDDGTVRQCASGKRVTFEDCGGEDAYMRVVEFSRDGGATWTPVVWKMTLPNARTLGK